MYINYELIQSIGISIGTLILLLFFRKLFLKIIFGVLEKLAKKTKSDLDDKLLLVIKKPVKIMLTILSFYIAYKVFDMELVFEEPAILKANIFVLKILKSFLIGNVGLIFYSSANESKVFFKELYKFFDIKVDKLLMPFISRIIKLVIMTIIVVAILEEWDFAVGTFITGLGIGGLAFALAAKDTLANAFGGAVLITEKPFTIGDWIVVDGVEGTVEDISFRSTKIRKFNKSVVTVPNSTVALSNIINYSKRDIRRVSYELKIKIDSPIESVKSVVKNIEEMLIKHPGINNETIFVRFNKFGESSLNIFMYYFTNTAIWGEYLLLTEDTNFKILEILAENKVELAVPMQVIKVENQ